MKLTGVVPKWRKRLPTGVMQSAFRWEVGFNGKRSGISADGLRWIITGAFAENLALLRAEYPYAYLLTNSRTVRDPMPTWSTWPRNLEEGVLARLPHARLGLDVFGSSAIPRDEQLSYLLEFGREDFSSFYPDLMGDRPPPLYAALFLAGDSGLCRWVETVTPTATGAEEWKSLLLTRFVLFLWVHERDLLLIESKDESLLKSLG